MEPEYENCEPLDESEQEEIARLIKDGSTSGQLSNDGKKTIAWKLCWNKW